MVEPSLKLYESIQTSAATGSGTDGTFSPLKQLYAKESLSIDFPFLIKKGNSGDALDHDTLPCSLHTIAHCSLVRSQYFHADADNEAAQSAATASTTASDGVVCAKRAVTTAAGISSSAAKSSASRSLLFDLSDQPSISSCPQIEPSPSWPGRTKCPIS